MKSVIETVVKNKEKLKKTPRPYVMTVTDIMEILDHAGAPVDQNVIDAIMITYDYGLIKGQRYEKNRQKKK